MKAKMKKARRHHLASRAIYACDACVGGHRERPRIGKRGGVSELSGCCSLPIVEMEVQDPSFEDAR